MNGDIELKYGGDRLRLRLPLPADPVFLKGREPRQQASQARFARDLDGRLDQASLAGRRVAVVVADKTRLCEYTHYLPVLADRLTSHGVLSGDIAFYIAYGTHPRQSERESRAAYGKVFSTYRFIHHDCIDDALFHDLGHTSRGTPVRLRRDILNADFVITFGAVSHHYFAGYGGGRKLVFPGLGARASIYHNHSLFLDPASRNLAAGCQPGRIDGNPLAADLAEIESHRPADLAIHGILNSHGRVCRLIVGSATGSFLAACRTHGDRYELTGGDTYELVVASCGGDPKDINFIQAHKAVHHAAAFVKDGGRLILLARCRDGIGSNTFLPWFEMGWQAAFDKLCRDYRGNGGTALAMMAKTRRISIHLVTGLSGDMCRTIGVHKTGARAAADMVARHMEALAVIPNASMLVRRWMPGVG
jgi:nickel-dependent lactate racemase